MDVPGTPSTGASREHLARQVFTTLSRSVLQQESDPARAEARLWRLPEVAVHFVFGVMTNDERAAVDPLVHRLRLEAAETINARLDRTAARQALAGRVRAAGQTLAMRPWSTADAATLASLLDNERLWAQLPESYPGGVGPDLAAHLIEASNAAPERHLVRAATWQEHVVGQARLQFDSSPDRESAEISYWLGEPFWGRGLATDLVTLFTAHSFASQPGLRRIFARVIEGHAASVRVLEKAGYRHESFGHRHVVKDGRRLNLHVLGVCRQDYAFEDRGESRVPPAVGMGAGWILMCTELWQAVEMVPMLM